MSKRKARTVRERFEAWAMRQRPTLMLLRFGKAGSLCSLYWDDTTNTLFRAFKAGLRAGRRKP